MGTSSQPTTDGSASGATSDDPTQTGQDTNDTDEPPMPTCDGIGDAVDDLGTTPGTIELPFPTLEHISVLWEIDGDTNNNSVVTVRYRPDGGPWSEGTPLRRTPAGSNVSFSWSNRHGGTVFALTPDTTYEIELALMDPDGGCAIETLQATTRAVPAAMPGAPIIPVTPDSFAAAASAAAPGDVLELAAGDYDGFVFEADGTANAPIVIRAAGDVTVTGDVRLDQRTYVILEGLTIEGQVKFNSGIGIAVKRCTINAVTDGIVLNTPGENAYIADNVIVGVTQWVESSFGNNGANNGEGIQVTGPGHVIVNNRVTGFRDAISLYEGREAVDQFSIDVLRNDIYQATDDGIEADFCFHNCRILANRLTNTFIGLSSQPTLGGPNYFIRNVLYNTVYQTFKPQRASVGDVIWHNTSVKGGDAVGVYTDDVFSRMLMRNNLFIGGPGGNYNGFSSGTGRVVRLVSAGDFVDLDYDAYGSTLGTFEGRIGDISFESLAEMQAMTTEANSIEVDLSVFAEAVALSDAPLTTYSPPDLRPAAGATIVDAGIPIAGINSDWAGSGPDIGAYEAGSELPTYGPRPR